MQGKYDILVLGDHRMGNTNQAIALAEELTLPYKVVRVEYNDLANLPNPLLVFSPRPLHIKYRILKSLVEEVKSSSPKLIISAGRRTATICLYLKKILPSVKIIQIMMPSLQIKYTKLFDLIITPQHDILSEHLENIEYTTGSLTNVQSKITNRNITEYKFDSNSSSFIAVLIGGSTKNYKFSKKDANLLCKYLHHIAKNYSMPFFFSFSRRTPEVVKKIIYNNFKAPHIIYDPNSGGDNPYLKILSDCKYIIATSDSISICSDAASTGKPLYIFLLSKLKSFKQIFFLQQLFGLGIAKVLDDNRYILDSYSYKPLNEIRRVAQIIHQRLLNKENFRL